MQPRSTETVVKALIMLQMVASVTLVVATFAAVVVEVPLYLAMLVLGGVGLMLLIANRQQRDPGVLLFGGSALVFAGAYYVCLYLLQLPLSPLYVVVLAYAVLCLAGGGWLLAHRRRRA